MKQTFLREISLKKLCTNKDKILLAVSGGIDSMVMLHLFHECGFSIAVAHANFQLRGNESDADEKFLTAICKKMAIPIFTKKFETESHAKKNDLSIQMAARELRYLWFNELLTEHHLDFVATAHHVNDSIETALLSLVRGSGLEAFDGIASKNKKIIRPLLFATRQDIEDYAKENKIEWREDRSNTTDDYPRNFVRHHIYPLLKELNPSLEKTFSESIEKISGAVELMDLGVDQWRDKFETKKGDQILLAKKGFEQFKNAENALWVLIKAYGFNLDQCNQIMNSLDGQSGKKFLSSNYELVIDREHLIIFKYQPKFGETLIQKNQTEAQLGRLTLTIEIKDKVEFKSDLTIATLDADKLQFPLRWRKWKDGDFFFPLGMNHKKKLSDFLIDQKISLADKGSVTVIESGNEIVWVVGLRLDNQYKTTAETKSVIVLQISSLS